MTLYAAFSQRLIEGNIPQIRYPGLPWFSILDYDTVAPLGAVMAKSRTAPLDVARFFAKQGKPSAPHAVLLYARDIPFELIINTKIPEPVGQSIQEPWAKLPGSCYVPTFVSMIPGTINFIKKISSSCNTTDNILVNFYIDGLWYRKIFIIDEITAPFSARMSKTLDHAEATGTLTNVLIDVAPKTYTKYFTYKDNVYISHGYAEESDDSDDAQGVPVLANTEQQEKYSSLLKQYTRQSVLSRAQELHPETITAQEIFAIQAAFEKKSATLQAPITSPVAQAAAVKQATFAKKSAMRKRNCGQCKKRRSSAKKSPAKRSRRPS